MTDMNATQTAPAAPTAAPTAGQGAAHLSAADFEQTIMNSTTPVFVDFYAEWCGPCKLAAPIVDKLAGEYAGKAIIAKLDTDANREVAQKFGIMSIPTVMIFKNEAGQIKELDRKVGFPGEEGYRQMLEKAVATAPAAAPAAPQAAPTPAA